MKAKRIISFILSAILIFSITSITSFASGGHSGFTTMKKLSKQEIVQLTKDPYVQNPEDIYSSAPSLTVPYYEGVIKDGITKAGLDRLNAYRRLAGLKNVTISNEYTDYAQTGALILAANKEFSHYPSKPSGMSQEMYETGYKGPNNGNIAFYYGYNPVSGPLALSVDMWMNDSDIYNIDALGHRRWILNPAMQKTGFGVVADNTMSVYSVLYAFDRSATADDYDFISWPPSGYMVNDTEFFTTDHAWNITLNPYKYDTYDLSAITVEMKSENGTHRFSFSGADGFFNIDKMGYGIPNSIIFRPQNIQNYNGEYTITVKGLRTISGTATTLSYTVDFFSSDEAEESVNATGRTGDINNDGKISASDARLVLRAAAKLENFNSSQTDIADVNGDNKITASDARKILRVAAKIDSF